MSGPPDDMDEDEQVDVSGVNTSSSDARDADNLRTAWILAVRNHVQKQTKQPCTYNSKVSLDGGFCRDSRRTYKPVWPKLVAAAKQEGLDPLRLVAVLFASLTTGPSPRRPSEILSPANIVRYHELVRTSKNRTAAALRTEEAVYSSAVWSASQMFPDPRMAVRFVLNDMSRQLSPLFRYSVARTHDMTDVAERWRELATRQATESPEGYLDAWGPIIPQDIIAAASCAAGRT